MPESPVQITPLLCRLSALIPSYFSQGQAFKTKFHANLVLGVLQYNSKIIPAPSYTSKTFTFLTSFFQTGSQFLKKHLPPLFTFKSHFPHSTGEMPPRYTLQIPRRSPVLNPLYYLLPHFHFPFEFICLLNDITSFCGRPFTCHADSQG